MDGENHGSKPYCLMDDLGGKNHPYFWCNTDLFIKPWALILRFDILQNDSWQLTSMARTLALHA